MNEKALSILVSGVVQGVGYRYFVFQLATRLGLVGWTKNNPDGTVAVYAEGSASLLEQLVQELKVGPRHAHVSAVEARPEKPTSEFSSFEIKGW